MEKAYDSVPHEKLSETLKEENIPEHYTNLIEEIYRENTATLYTPMGKCEGEIKIEKGIKQGCALSPLLWILFINPLLKKIEETGLGYSFHNKAELKIPHITFVDDINIIANNIEEPQKCLNQLAIDEKVDLVHPTSKNQGTDKGMWGKIRKDLSEDWTNPNTGEKFIPCWGDGSHNYENGRTTAATIIGKDRSKITSFPASAEGMAALRKDLDTNI